MNAIDARKQIQTLLGVESDGQLGKRSLAAFTALAEASADSPWLSPKPTGQLVGDGSWPWINARIDGDDIVIEPGIVTAFGGAHDTMDSGETASGVSTKDNPSFIGCALPMRRDGNKELRGSPIPRLPWKSTVIFTASDGTQVSTKLIDEGPARWTKHIGDLTEAAAKLFDPSANANNFEKKLSIRIIGGAQYATG